MIILIFILLAIITILTAYIVIDKTQGIGVSTPRTAQENEEEKIQQTKLQKLLFMEKIQNNLITSCNKDIGCIINVTTPDYQVMSEADQTIYENRMIDLVFKLNFDIKVITIVRNINMTDTIENLQKERENITNKKLFEYSQELEEALYWEQEGKVFQKYYVLYSRKKGTYEEKLKDLKYMTTNFIESIESAGSKAKILKTNELLELTNVILKKYEKIDMKQIEEIGAFEIAS